jgi:hypothetical protein
MRELLVRPIDVQLRGSVGIRSVQEEEEDKRTRRFVVAQREDVSWWLQVSFGGPSLLLSYLFLAAFFLGKRRERFEGDFKIYF